MKKIVSLEFHRHYIIVTLLILLSAVFCSAQEQISITRVNTIPDNAKINDLLVNGDVLYTATSAGLYAVDIRSLKAELIRELSCDAICFDNTGALYASFENRFLENIRSKEQNNYNIPELEVRDIEFYKGKVWIASNEGVITMNSRTNAVNAAYNKRNSKLNSDNISFLHIDDQKKMWIGTEEGIVIINEKEKWKIYERNLSMEAMHYNHEGLWLVSNEEMWLVDPFNRWYPTAVEKGLKEGPIRDITADSTGRLYMASDILVRYDPYKEEIESYKDTPSLVSKQCSAVESDKDNRIWLGTSDSGLFLIGFKNEAKNQRLSAFCLVEENLKCPGDKATVVLNVTGGEKPYNITWSDGVAGNKKRELYPGIYEIQVKDGTGRIAKSSIAINDLVPMKLAVLSTENETIPGKKDGKAEIIVTGGAAPYQVIWPNKEQGLKVNKLGLGAHEVKVTDANGCKITAKVEIFPDKVIPELELSKITVGQTVQINNLFFQADSTEVLQESYYVLDEIYNFLHTNPGVIIEIGGHTNNIPSHEYCDKLSTERAKNVAYYLYNKGISEDRISYKGYGKRNPIASNQSLAGRKKNQRVEIKIIQVAG